MTRVEFDRFRASQVGTGEPTLAPTVATRYWPPEESQ